MKYLFFGVECSNCHNRIGKLCEFGYVLTDENVKILAKDNLPMSPGRGYWSRFVSQRCAPRNTWSENFRFSKILWSLNGRGGQYLHK